MSDGKFRSGWDLRFLVAIVMVACLVGCGEDEGSPTKPVVEDPICGELLVVTSDYETGSISVVKADSSYAIDIDLASIHSDAIARARGNEIYIVNRLGQDNIQVLDRSEGFATVRQFSVGAGTNPHDICVVSEGKAYVSRNGVATVLEVALPGGETVDEISLAVFADEDGTPDMDRMIYLDPYLFVSLQRIDFGGGTYEAVSPSLLGVIDARDNHVVDVDADKEGIQAIELTGLNPIGPIVLDERNGELLVACAGRYGVLDGGIERVDPNDLESLGWLVTEEALGGDLIDFVLVSADLGYAVVSDAAWVTSLVSFELATGSKLATLYASDGYELSDLAVTPCGDLVVCDRDYEQPGLRLFNAETGEEITGFETPLDTGLPPFEIIVLD